MIMDDLPIYVAFLLLLVGLGVVAYVLSNTPETDSLEKVKVRFAAVTFTGIMLLIVFTAVVYIVHPDPGKEIFDKVFTALTPIAGGIIGYLFGTQKDRP